jgi:hypothetical protein
MATGEEGERISFALSRASRFIYSSSRHPSPAQRDSADSQDTQLLLLLIHFHGLSVCLFPAHIPARIVFLPPRIALLLFCLCILAVFIVLSE